MPPRFEKNAPGDFYIVDQCCITCGVMHDVAPDLLAWHNYEPDERGYVQSHCYVARQPETPDEFAQMVEAMEVMDVNCLRYAGEDPELLQRIVGIGERDQCDVFGPGDYRWLGERGD